LRRLLVGSHRYRRTLSVQRHTFSSAFGAVDPRIAPALRLGASSLCAKWLSDCARLCAVIADFPNDISWRQIPCCSNCLPVRSSGSGFSYRDSPHCKNLSQPFPRRRPAVRRIRPAVKRPSAPVALTPRSAAVRTAAAPLARFAPARMLAVACARFAPVKAAVARWDRSATARAAAVSRGRRAVPARSAAPPLRNDALKQRRAAACSAVF
jgi:hypothetical protein